MEAQSWPSFSNARSVLIYNDQIKLSLSDNVTSDFCKATDLDFFEIQNRDGRRGETEEEMRKNRDGDEKRKEKEIKFRVECVERRREREREIIDS